MNPMPPEWIRWIEENIARGVPQDVLIDTLVQHRFERGQASYAVESRMPGYLLLNRAAPVTAAAASATKYGLPPRERKSPASVFRQYSASISSR